MFFENRSQKPFSDGQTPIYGKKSDFWPIVEPPWASKWLAWATFSTKKAPKSESPVPQTVLGPTWARFGAENAPRAHFDRFGLIFDRCCTNSADFGRFFMFFEAISDRIQVSLVNFHWYLLRRFFFIFCFFSHASLANQRSFNKLRPTRFLVKFRHCFFSRSSNNRWLFSVWLSYIAQSFGLILNERIILVETCRFINLPAPSFE